MNGLQNTDLWLEWSSSSFTRGMPVAVGVKIPLVSEMKNFGTTTDIDKTALFYVSVSSFFQ